MPIFDFECQECGKKFDLMISNADKGKAKCPECHSPKIKQMLSLFNTGGGSKSSPMSDNCSTCSARTGGG